LGRNIGVSAPHDIFITGGTGYVGSRLIPILVGRGHRVRALAREQSVAKLPGGCTPVVGDALDAASFSAAIAPADTFIQLVGTPHPAPWKGAAFERVDAVSGKAGIDAACAAGIRHFIYVSVAQPAPVMRAYLRVRAEVERQLAQSGLDATVLRPWYVLGPGHWWPYALVPAYQLARLFAPTREMATRLGLVTLRQLLAALVDAVEHPPAGRRVWDVPAILGRESADQRNLALPPAAR
jgi:uncharacterized protein YbjT (DUF2867 family)